LAAVSNACPLITLSKLGRLALLPELYGRMFLPRTVYQEVVVTGLREGHDDAIAVDHLVKLGRFVVRDSDLAAGDQEWASRIDRGEAEAVKLAREIGATWAIIDNAHARRAARSQGVQPRGTIGVLLEAASRDILSIPELELLLEEIKQRPDFWISERLCDAALEQARSGQGERPALRG
jgi:predicted nucleic acid-binding protein